MTQECPENASGCPESDDLPPGDREGRVCDKGRNNDPIVKMKHPCMFRYSEVCVIQPAKIQAKKLYDDVVIGYAWAHGFTPYNQWIGFQVDMINNCLHFFTIFDTDTVEERSHWYYNWPETPSSVADRGSLDNPDLQRIDDMSQVEVLRWIERYLKAVFDIISNGVTNDTAG